MAAKKILSKGSELDTELLLAFLLNKNREYLLSHGEEKISEKLINKYKKLITRRRKGEPVAYITGHKEFFGLAFMADKNVLIPRPETEILVEEALTLLRSKVSTLVRTKKIVCIDIGTGSGCIIISLAEKLINSPLLNPYHSRENGNPEKKESYKTKLDSRLRGNDNTIEKNIKFIGLDISEKSLKTARKNATKYGLEKFILFKRNDLLKNFFIENSKFIQNLKLKIKNCHILITANLPYVPSKILKILDSPETVGLKYEPPSALDGGPDGLDFYRKLAEQVKNIYKVNKNIALLCEIAPNQSGKMKKIFSFMKNEKIKKDLAGLDRVFIASYNKIKN